MRHNFVFSFFFLLNRGLGFLLLSPVVDMGFDPLGAWDADMGMGYGHGLWIRINTDTGMDLQGTLRAEVRVGLDRVRRKKGEKRQDMMGSRPDYEGLDSASYLFLVLPINGAAVSSSLRFLVRLANGSRALVLLAGAFARDAIDMYVCFVI